MTRFFVMLFQFILSDYDIQDIDLDSFKSKLDFANMLPLSNLMLMADIKLIARGIIAFVILQKKSNDVME